jgi:UDP-GlcNAc:undecaprenyl-phosphate GlcNAc-1-phosphate transferase
MGGLGIYLGFIGGIIVAFVFDNNHLLMRLPHLSGLIISSSLMLLLGIYDDIQGSNAQTKFMTQLIISLLFLKMGFVIDSIIIPNLINIKLGYWSIPITLLWLVGITNAINLIDGLDGLASGIVGITAVFLVIYGFLFNQPIVIYLSLALAGANLAFLRYNFYPAKIFMGDTGSLFLGFVIGGLAIYRHNDENLNSLLFLPIAFTLLLPIADAALAVFRRTLRKQHIFRSDFSHIHHYYIKLGFNQAKTVVRFYVMTFCLGLATLLCYFINKFFISNF